MKREDLVAKLLSDDVSSGEKDALWEDFNQILKPTDIGYLAGNVKDNLLLRKIFRVFHDLEYTSAGVDVVDAFVKGFKRRLD